MAKVKFQIHSRQEYKAALVAIEKLMVGDPGLNTPKGRRLDRLVLMVQVYELEASLDLIHKSDRRGIKMWQAAHPEHKGMIWPDRGKMIFWLLGQLGKKGK